LSYPGLRSPGQAERLTGRDEDLRLIRSFLADAAARGGVLLLSGEAGVGKTTLLEAAASAATTAGTRVIRAAGAEFEADVSFSGLNQLLLPLLEDLGRLDRPLRDALSVALGLGGGPPPDRRVVADAMLALLGQAADGRSLLLLIDDVQWLDRSSALVLARVARRLAAPELAAPELAGLELAGRPIGLLAAARSGTESFFEGGELPGHEVRPLDEAAAAGLVQSRFPGLAARVRRRLLTEAQGNPLALLELPAALSDPQRAAVQALPPLLPLSRRLQALFATRVSDLPAVTRRTLLIAALDGTGDLGVLPGTADRPRPAEALAPAERAGLVRVDDDAGRLAFRHPLTRSAIMELSASDERRAAHQALAGQLADQPERRAWHLAEAAAGPDEEVAGLLEQTAWRTLRRGDAVGAVATLLRAAELSPRRTDRSRRMVQAAYLGADVAGDLKNVSRLLDDARRADPEIGESLAAAVAAAHGLLNGDGDVDTAHRLLMAAIDAHRGLKALGGRPGTHAKPGPEDATFLEALHTLLLVCAFGGRAELWEPFYAVLGPRPPTVLYLWTHTFADPAHAAVPALGALDDAIARLAQEADPVRIVRIGIAADYVDRLAGCRQALWQVVRDGREGGAVASAINAMTLLCFDAFRAGQWDEAGRLAAEGLGLCRAHGYRLLAWLLQYGQALLAAARGDYDTAEKLTDEITRWAGPRGGRAVQAYACHAGTLAAMGQGDFERAYQQAAAVSPAGVFASHVPHALRVAFDLVESAARTGRHAEAAAHVAVMREIGLAGISPRLALIVTGAAAIAAPDDEITPLFAEALAIPGAGDWPFDLARVRLAYGERLRRARATAQARQQLGAALEVFRRLGARPWQARAENELRAAGLDPRTPKTPKPPKAPKSQETRETRGTREFPGTTWPAPLTPQEYEVAMLAAAGLTNKQIGERLYLSHRTVAAHLYQAFPKLGVTSRAALRDALAALPPPPP
jgi:DNA-binding CsgD family transcriptional regulator/tetratricopeptide (TPR) repeat protein